LWGVRDPPDALQVGHFSMVTTFSREAQVGHFSVSKRVTFRLTNIARRILERLELHYTPKHGSWLNIVEIELSILSEQCLDDRIPDGEALQRRVQSWEAARNEKRATVNWQFGVSDARAKLERLYPNLSESS